MNRERYLAVGSGKAKHLALSGQAVFRRTVFLSWLLTNAVTACEQGPPADVDTSVVADETCEGAAAHCARPEESDAAAPLASPTLSSAPAPSSLATAIVPAATGAVAPPEEVPPLPVATPNPDPGFVLPCLAEVSDAGPPETSIELRVFAAIPEEPEVLIEPYDVPVCGDGIVDSIETCDDGNTVAGTGPTTWDGCGDCTTIDPGFVCDLPRLPCRSVNYCGDFRITAPETCDDGNTVPGDGCSAFCTLEAGYSIETVGGGLCLSRNEEEAAAVLGRCGDGVVQITTESCDLGDALNDGSYSRCTAECAPAEHCGDGIVQAEQMEECDDGNRQNGDSCSGICTTERRLGAR